MSKYNLEISILTALLPDGILLPHALKTITDNQAYLRSVLTRLKHAGLVSDRHRTLKAPKATYTIRYLEMILSIIVGTFSSNIHTLMRSYLRNYSIAASLPWEEARHWKYISACCSNS